MFPGIKEELSLVLGFSFMSLHLYTWYAFFKYKLYKKSYLPIMLMLYSYALTAGIMFYRVPVFGYEYMHQPRYFRVYNIGLWGSALVLLSIYYVKSTSGGTVAVTRRKIRWLLYFAVFIVVGVQLTLANHAWKDKKYQLAWQKQHAKNIIYYSGDTDFGVPCTKAKASFPICSMNSSKREELIGFLENEKLNVFSERIRKDYLYNIKATSSLFKES